MRPICRSLLLILPFSQLFLGCAAEGKGGPHSGAVISDYLLTCDSAPAVPPEHPTGTQVGDYLTDLHRAWQNCSGHLAEVRKRLGAR